MRDDREIGCDFSSLMARAQAGDQEAYGALLRALLPLLRGLVGRHFWACARTDREDVVQDILLSLHLARATYDLRRPFLPWVLAITHHRIVDARRCASRRWSHEILTDSPPEPVPDVDTNFSESSAGDVEVLRQAIANLPRSQQQALRLLKLEEMTLQEAAAQSGMSISALKAATHRAMGTLRERLAYAHG